MIDLHCHILPGMDDGPATPREAVKMCRLAAADGIRTIVATPHFKPGSCEWTGQDLFEGVGLLNALLGRERIPVEILPGAEVSVFPELPSRLAPGGALTINRGIYFLIEFRPAAVPAGWEGFLQTFLDAGLVPVIAHPERNHWFMGHPGELAGMVRRGALLQVTASSITGGLGPEVREFCAHLLVNNLVHVIGTDAHAPDLRPPALSGAVARAADLVGERRARAMVTSVPAEIIAGRKMQVPEPKGPLLPGDAQNRGWLRRLFGGPPS